MMNWIFVLMLISGLAYGFITGEPEAAAEAMTAGATEAVTLCVTLLGAYMFWMGLMNVMNKAGLVNGLYRLARPMMARLMRGEEHASAPVTMNLAANFFGLGSAATPFGLEAMKQLQERNPDKTRATNGMVMFLAMNSAALELIPAGVIALRSVNGSQEPYIVIVPTFIASVITFGSALLFAKLFFRLEGLMKGRRRA